MALNDIKCWTSYQCQAKSGLGYWLSVIDSRECEPNVPRGSEAELKMRPEYLMKIACQLAKDNCPISCEKPLRGDSTFPIKGQVGFSVQKVKLT